MTGKCKLDPVYGIPNGVDFPKALVDGLIARFQNAPPHALAQVEIIVNTRRMARRMRDLFDAGPALLLPRIRLLSDIEELLPDIIFPPANSALKRRLELAQLISALLEKEQNFGARASLFDLADSLAGLMDEMQGEGVSSETIANLDVSDQSGHWERAQTFINIAQSYINHSQDAPDNEARQRLIVETLIEEWEKNPPKNPVILAGSTGSRGTTLMLMQAIAKLPQGALVLPGFDFDMPESVWHMLSNALKSEDHPQYRFHKILESIDKTASDVKYWSTTPPAAPSRNALLSLALRPAPVTDAWLTEGPDLPGVAQGLEGVTLVQAETPREEALAIALRLRKAAQDGQTAALITPDRMLTRQVSAALDRWDILPDDSAGAPLHLSPPGRFLRHVAGLFSRTLDTEALLTLLKHPITHSGHDRGFHQLNTQRLELRIRKDGLPYPTPEGLEEIARKAALRLENPGVLTGWARWVGQVFCDHTQNEKRPLQEWIDRHIQLAQAIAAGQNGEGSGELWLKNAGIKAREVFDTLTEHAEYGGEMSARDYGDLMGGLLAGEEVRDRDAPHPHILFWGTLEARVQGADLTILSGLNEGTWPEAPKPDTWLNRALRNQAGLLLPERRIGLSAHDFQQAVAASEVWITRSVRSDDAETVPSRWLNRLQNLLGGLPQKNGPAILQEMISRGDEWLEKAKLLEEPTPSPRAHRPSPRPPLVARPHALSVTEIKRLIRDPYAIYAKHSLRLRRLNPIVQSPDAPMRGILIHAVMERFIKDVMKNPECLNSGYLIQIATEVLTNEVPWPAARALWLAKLSRVADWFVAREIERQARSEPIAFEKQAKGVLNMHEIGFTLTGYADRIDKTGPNNVAIFDYKTGAPPTEKQQERFDKQLLIEAAMLEQGGFEHVGIHTVDEAVFIGLGSTPKEVRAPLRKNPPDKILDELSQLIRAYLSPEQGFTAQRSIESERERGDYDHLARFGEWDDTDIPMPEDLA